MKRKKRKISTDNMSFAQYQLCKIILILLVNFKTALRATFCNHGESSDNFSFFESLILSPMMPFDELFLKTTLKTSSDIYFFKTCRKSDLAPEVPIFECK